MDAPGFDGMKVLSAVPDGDGFYIVIQSRAGRLWSVTIEPLIPADNASGKGVPPEPGFR
jgi:hypothetical protein